MPTKLKNLLNCGHFGDLSCRKMYALFATTCQKKYIVFLTGSELCFMLIFFDAKEMKS